MSITDCQTNSVKKIEMKTSQVLGPQFPSFALTKGVLDTGVQQDCTHKASLKVCVRSCAQFEWRWRECTEVGRNVAF